MATAIHTTMDVDEPGLFDFMSAAAGPKKVKNTFVGGAAAAAAAEAPKSPAKPAAKKGKVEPEKKKKEPEVTVEDVDDDDDDDESKAEEEEAPKPKTPVKKAPAKKAPAKKPEAKKPAADEQEEEEEKPAAKGKGKKVEEEEEEEKSADEEPEPEPAPKTKAKAAKKRKSSDDDDVEKEKAPRDYFFATSGDDDHDNDADDASGSASNEMSAKKANKKARIETGHRTIRSTYVKHVEFAQPPADLAMLVYDTAAPSLVDLQWRMQTRAWLAGTSAGAPQRFANDTEHVSMVLPATAVIAGERAAVDYAQSHYAQFEAAAPWGLVFTDQRTPLTVPQRRALDKAEVKLAAAVDALKAARAETYKVMDQAKRDADKKTAELANDLKERMRAYEAKLVEYEAEKAAYPEALAASKEKGEEEPEPKKPRMPKSPTLGKNTCSVTCCVCSSRVNVLSHLAALEGGAESPLRADCPVCKTANALTTAVAYAAVSAADTRVEAAVGAVAEAKLPYRTLVVYRTQ